MHEAAATPAWVLLAYLVAGVCFILALRGLSNPDSSRRGNRAGMIGMAIAVVTTLAVHEVGSFLEIGAAIAIGGAIGLVTARKIQMTAMPQLVAAAAKGSAEATWLGLRAVVLASVNIFGGFAVTARMLAMYKKKER